MAKKKSPSETVMDTLPAPASPGKTPPEHNNGTFYIAGIGASAGGLDALKQFFSHMPEGKGIAFIVLQHFDPGSKSILTNILQRTTPMKVVDMDIENRIQPNHVYVMPAHKHLTLSGKIAFLEDCKETPLHRKPIDDFFTALAQNQESCAAGIILSGAGNDGAAGIKAIKESGGITMAQDVNSAEFDGMPESAIATECVDFILPPHEMPAKLLQCIKDRRTENPEKTEAIPPKYYRSINDIIKIILMKTGHNFSHYKKNTFARRIEKRMSQNCINSITQYVSFLQQSPSEANGLFRELLITVTHFFREMENDAVIKEKVFSEIFKNKSAGDVVRIWVPGCATGEEPYSIAMLLTECMEEVHLHFKIQIFATDLNEDAIHFARAALYPQDRIDHISPERMKRFFHKKNHSFVINSQIREMVIFSCHNIIKDPPFSRMDMISCKNLLIYFDTALQDRLLPLFYHVLRPNGYLFLGKSESIRGFSRLFATIGEKNRIFKKIHSSVSLSTVTALSQEKNEPFCHKEQQHANTVEPVSMKEHMAKVLFDEFSPPCVIINEDYTILHIHGKMDGFLKLPAGEPSFNIIKMACEALRPELRVAIKQAVKQKMTIYSKPIRMNTDDSPLTINITVRPFPEAHAHSQLYIVVFHGQRPPSFSGDFPPLFSHTKETSPHIAALEKELAETKKSLCDILENLEDVNGKMKQAHEIVREKDEELRSTEEELETTKEELQSMNEELNIINAELQYKIDDLSKANSDINTLLSSTEIGTVFLDKNLCIKRFTPAAGKMMNLMESDVKRPISHLNTFLIREKLTENLEKVFKTLIPYEKEIKEPDNTWYLVRFLPYQTENNMIDGIVITIVNITKLKRAQEEIFLLEKLILSINESDSFPSAMKSVLHTVCEFTNWTLGEVWIPDKSGAYLMRSASWFPREPGLQNFDALSRKQTFEKGAGLPGRTWSTKQVEWVRDVTLDKNFARAELARSHGLKAGMAIPVLAKDVVVAVIVFFMFEACGHDEQFVKLVSSVASQLGVTFRRKQAEEELKMSNNLLRAVIEGITDAIFVKDLEGRIVLANSAVYTLLEKPLNEILGRKNDEIFSADIAEKINTEDNMVLHSGKMQRFEREIPVNGGKTKLILSIKSPYRDNSGKSIGLVDISKDITGLKKSC